MTNPNLQLFLNKFISTNQELYANNPTVLAMLEGLTLNELSFTRLEVDESLGSNGRIADFECESRGFNAVSQQWICADFTGVGVLNNVDATVHADADEVKLLDEVGVYFFDAEGNKHVAVLIEDIDTNSTIELAKDRALALLAAHAAFDLAAATVTWPDDAVVDTDFLVHLKTDCIDADFLIQWRIKPEPVQEPTPPVQPPEPDPEPEGDAAGAEDPDPVV